MKSPEVGLPKMDRQVLEQFKIRLAQTIYCAESTLGIPPIGA